MPNCNKCTAVPRTAEALRRHMVASHPAPRRRAALPPAAAAAPRRRAAAAPPVPATPPFEWVADFEGSGSGVAVQALARPTTGVPAGHEITTLKSVVLFAAGSQETARAALLLSAAAAEPLDVVSALVSVHVPRTGQVALAPRPAHKEGCHLHVLCQEEDEGRDEEGNQTPAATTQFRVVATWNTRAAAPTARGL